MNRRQGITLLEVLVAIFVMALGILAFLTFFPLGAQNMRQAMRDNHALQAGANADAAAVALDLRHDPPVASLFATGAAGPLPAGWDGPSYPVFVDPFGAEALGHIQRANPTVGQGGIRGALPWFALTDDIEFDATAQPALPPGVPNPPVPRACRYTWAYLLRQPRYGDAGVLELTVVVYAGRDLVVPDAQPAFAATGKAGDTSVVVSSAPGSPPSLQAGGGVVDTTNEMALGPAGNPRRNGPVRSYFYRVVGVTDGGNGLMQLELQTPLQADLPSNGGTVAVLDPVAEVFQRGASW
jgi:hypothetical protein